jgi:DNA (cytosine-5)-methyltransferase 1
MSLATDKPPYRIPSMAEIAAIPPCGLTVASTFSGCGGSSLGYKMAGFTVLWANEFVPAARDVYTRNHPGTVLDGRDIREVAPADILAATALAAGELDVLDGSPPCASFSTAGKREAGWGKVRKYSDTAQRVDDLFFEFARLVGGVRPRVFIAENVYGLVRGTAKGYFLDILRALKACGYRVEARLLDAQWLSVPQTRRRLFFQGVREDLGRAPAWPKPLPYRYSVREALADLWAGAPARAVHDTRGRREYCRGDVTDRPCAPVVASAASVKHYQIVGPPTPDIGRFAIGREWERLAPGEQSAKYLNLVRPDPDGPCPTVTAAGGQPGIASVTHPAERRKFTIAELKRVCGFPDDLVLTGTYAQQWERLGRAVPPPMMYHLAAAVRDGVFAKGR